MPTPNLAPTDDTFGPVPEANQPGHHPEVEQDKPTGPWPGPPVGASAGGPTRFDFRFELLLRPFAALATVLPRSAYVVVDDDEVTVHFGVWGMAFPRTAVVDVQETGGFWLPKVAGPPHVSFADGGITFATNRQRGTCITLAHPQRGPYPWLRHPNVTVTVDAPEDLEAALLR
jgi:hypothetical protein